MNIGQRIKARRKELGVSADKLAEMLGKDRSTVFRYEKGDIENLPLDILEPIAKALKTTPAYIMGWEEIQKKGDTLSDIVLKMNKDENFMSIVEKLYRLDAKQLNGASQILNAFLQQFEN